MANARTRAVAKYQAKIGLVARTYKLKANVADDFKKACEISGKSQASVLMRLMSEYVSANSPGTDITDEQLEPTEITTKTPKSESVNKNKPLITQEIVAKWEELNANGLSYVAIADKKDGLGYNASTISRNVAKLRKKLTEMELKTDST